MRPVVQLVVFMLLSFAVLMFVWYTTNATWQENLEYSNGVLMTDYIKVLVQFLQYTGIVGSVSVPWSLFDVQQWLQALGIVVTVGAGQALSLDCWLNNYFPHSKLSILRLAVCILAPVITWLLVLGVQCLSWAVRRWFVPLFWQSKEGDNVPHASEIVRKLPVIGMVLGFYSYPTLVRVALSFFACLDIDKLLSALSNVPAGATAPLSHKWGYWVSSIDQQCFSGYHLRWSLSLGLPFVLLWCVLVPVGIGVGLSKCKHRATNASFREHFGFLYRTYKPECMYMWWEAVWVARTVVLTLISVFAFPMQRYFSVLSLLLVFWASAALQLYFKPYKERTLHHMHLVSTACMAATTLGALAMFAYDIQESTASACPAHCHHGAGVRHQPSVCGLVPFEACASADGVVCHPVCHDQGVGDGCLGSTNPSRPQHRTMALIRRMLRRYSVFGSDLVSGSQTVRHFLPMFASSTTVVATHGCGPCTVGSACVYAACWRCVLGSEPMCTCCCWYRCCGVCWHNGPSMCMFAPCKWQVNIAYLQ
jgi:hypothetical protein